MITADSATVTADSALVEASGKDLVVSLPGVHSPGVTDATPVLGVRIDDGGVATLPRQN